VLGHKALRHWDLSPCSACPSQCSARRDAANRLEGSHFMNRVHVVSARGFAGSGICDESVMREWIIMSVIVEGVALCRFA
jgi:hypothetical protein